MVSTQGTEVQIREADKTETTDEGMNRDEVETIEREGEREEEEEGEERKY